MVDTSTKTVILDRATGKIAYTWRRCGIRPTLGKACKTPCSTKFWMRSHADHSTKTARDGREVLRLQRGWHSRGVAGCAEARTG